MTTLVCEAGLRDGLHSTGRTMPVPTSDAHAGFTMAGVSGRLALACEVAQ
jgi:hypothetical protein